MIISEEFSRYATVYFFLKVTQRYESLRQGMKPQGL